MPPSPGVILASTTAAMAVDPRCHYVETSLKLDGARISERLIVIRRELSEFAARFASAKAPGDPATNRQGARGKGAGQSGKMSRIPRFGCFSGIRQKLQGVAKDLEEARKWYIQAAAKGDVVAKKKLSELSGAH